MVSIVIPSRNEMFLVRTVQDIYEKAKGEFEVIVICDEKIQELEPRPNLMVVPKSGPPGLRSAINQAVELAQGKFILKVDAHCMFDEGFDVKLSAECEDHWVVIPRRYSLEPKDWSIRTYRPTIDYEYYVFPFRNEQLKSVRTGGKWHERTAERQHILLDEDMAFQGSCWFTTKEHLKSIDGFGIDTSTGEQFVLESEELANKTWLSGGKVMVNKKTWYAHLHKGYEYGRGYFLNKKPMKQQRVFHTIYWHNNRWPKQIYTMKWLIDKFMPIPGWPEDWQNPKYEQEWRQANGLEPANT